MTREEAISVIQEVFDNAELSHCGHYATALDMAIEALHREEAEEKGYCHRIIPRNVEVVVRCKDCKWAEKAILDEYCVECTMYHTSCMKHGYCHHGERREP